MGGLLFGFCRISAKLRTKVALLAAAPNSPTAVSSTICCSLVSSVNGAAGPGSTVPSRIRITSPLCADSVAILANPALSAAAVLATSSSENRLLTTCNVT